MATETTRVSSYVRAEGFYDSAGTRYQYASAVNNLVSGLTTAVNASSLVNLVSGLVTGVKASALNDIISGVTVSAGQINTVTGFPSSAAYAVSAGTLSGVTATPAMLNALLYGTRYKVAFGSTVATNAVVMSCVTNCGLSTALFALVTPQVTGISVGAVVTQTGVQWQIHLATSATATQGTVTYMIVGNA